MSVSIILSLTLCSVFLFPLMAQPLSLGLSIMFSTLLLCLLVGLYISSWYAYILFLIYVGGLLVMFAYVAALSPNILFGSTKPFFFFLGTQILMSPILFYSVFPDISTLSQTLNSQEALLNMKTLGIELVSPSLISVLIGLGIILLINLIVVVKICYYQHGTLRPHKTIYATAYSKNTPYLKNN
uniref:NADH-ubiquinone oxidoreductase chain 6 n=1 Tax=Melanoides tuberculata TaxID=55729 RepID=A0A8F6HAH4_MELTU|nr:NADH dehydrogenase subunit 6 [Melanoides tuberculata]